MIPPRRIVIAALVLAMLAGPGVAPGFAHALLRAAQPAPASLVPAAPAWVRLTFSETVEPLFCSIKVTDAAGKQVDDGSLVSDPADRRRLMIRLKPIPPGEYLVTWSATSTDTHRTQGHFRFQVSR